jgi:hypothetical protein
MKDDKETNQIIKTVEELFIKNVNNTNQLSQLIDKYLIPQELEKKSNAEISTPYKLRNEMLDKIPIGFWSVPHTVFEPCSGKGGFVIDIIDRFMNGLKKTITDEKKRYKLIVEECLYFSDINPTNIFICKLLIDPYNEYELNFNEGNTLELDIQDKWSIEGFDAIIGNPPYQNKNKKGDNHLYIDFTVYSIKNIIDDGILLYITPKLILDNLLRCDINRKRINKFYNIKFIAIDTPKKYFPNIGTNFIYFILAKNTNIHTCDIEYIYDKHILKSTITLNEGMLLPNKFDKIGLNIINKTTNKLHHSTKQLFTSIIQKPLYFINGKYKQQRIRKEHFNKGIIMKTKTDVFKYHMSNGFTRKKYKYPGELYFFNYIMNDYNKSKIIISNIGFEVEFDEIGDLNISDSLSYIISDKIKFQNFKKLVSSKLIKFILMYYKNNTLHDTYKLFTKNLYYIPLEINMCDNNIYKYFNLTNDEIKLIESSILNI